MIAMIREGVPVTVMAKNDEYTLVCVEYLEERNMMHGSMNTPIK
ncbi:MAG: hypothetical protein ACLURQ_18535 [Bacteroides thetaiotaomicron]